MSLSVSIVIFAAAAVAAAVVREYFYERKLSFLIDMSFFRDRKVRRAAALLYVLCVPLMLTRIGEAEQWLAGMLALVLAFYTTERTADFVEEVHYSMLAGPDDIINYVMQCERVLPLFSLEESFEEFCERVEEEADEYESKEYIKKIYKK